MSGHLVGALLLGKGTVILLPLRLQVGLLPGGRGGPGAALCGQRGGRGLDVLLAAGV